ncbi:hypothetical protein GCM10007389_18010 [Pontibacter akesuensis]|nr:hypothetical protein GCM10007389_18010 [Pontibacter akesuensis]
MLAWSKVSDAGGSVVNASVGVANGPIAGFPPGSVKRGRHSKDAVAIAAHEDAVAAFLNASLQLPTHPLYPGNLTGKTLTPGVYSIIGDAALGGVLTIDGQFQPNATFIIRVTGNFAATSNAIIRLKSGATSKNVFFVVDNEVNISSNSDLVGNFLAEDNVMMENSRLLGRLISLKGEVNLKNSTLSLPVDLAISIRRSGGTYGPDTYGFGESITYYIRVQNNGPVNEEGIKVRDINVLGVQQGFSSTLPTTLYDPQTGVWTVGALAYGESAELTITSVINKAGINTVSAVVEGAGVDETIQNNSVVQSFCVLLSEPTPIQGPTEVCANGTYIYKAEPVSGASRYTWNVPRGWTYRLVDANDPTTIQVTVGQTDEAGFVSLKVSNVCGEGPARSLEVTPVLGVPAKPSAIEGPVSFCVSAQGLTYRVAPQPNTDKYTWQLPNGWSFVSGQGTNEIVVNASAQGGKVSVIPSNACGDGEEQELQVIINNAPPGVPAAIRGTGQGCAGKTTTYEVTPIPGITKYYWGVPADWVITSGEGTNKIVVKVGTSEGNVTVLAENSCGKGPLASLPVKPVTTVTLTPGPITGDLNSCVNAMGLVYSVQPVAQAIGYVWQVPAGWVITAGEGTNSITVNASSNGGELSVTAINDCGVSGKSAIAIVPATAKPAVPGAIAGSSFGCVKGTGTYSISAVTGATSYVWEVPVGWAITSGNGTTSINVTVGSASGNIRVKALNSCGESSFSEISVTPTAAVPAPPVAITGPLEVCQGEAGYTYSISPIAGVKSYTWSAPEGWVITSGNGTTSIKVKAGPEGGNITVAAVNDCGAGTAAVLAVSVVPSPPDKPGAITGLASVCASQKNIVYTIQPVNGATSYRWSVGVNNGWSIVSGNGTTSITVNAGAVATTIAVQAINACGVTSETQLTTVVTDGVPVKPGPITGSTVLCIGKEYTFSIQPVKDALSYKWELPAGWEPVGSTTGTTIKVITTATGGTVRVSALNSCGRGPEESLAVTPTNNAPITPGAISGSTDLCVSGEATFSIAAVTGASGYVWKVPTGTGWSILSGQNTTSIRVKVGQSAGNISVAAKNDCGEGTASTKTITISTTPPAKPGAITGDKAVCASSKLTYSIALVAGATEYVWQVPQEWVILSGQGTASISVTAGSTAGTITVVAKNGCGNNGNATLAVTPASGTAIAPGPITAPAYSFCQGATNLTYSIAAVAGATSYKWEAPQGWTIKSGQGTTSINVTAGATTGTMKVTAVNPCGEGGSQTLAVAPQSTPLVAQIEVGSGSPCAGASTTYTVKANTNIDSYLWEVPQGWTILSGQGTGTITVKTFMAGGTVKVKAKNSCGEAGIAEVRVSPVQEKPDMPTAVQGNAGVCIGATEVYTVPNASSFTAYTWEVPQGWQIISGQGTGAITVVAGREAGKVTVVASTGCGAADPVSLEVSTMDAQGLQQIVELSSPCLGLVYEVAPLAGATTYTWTVPAGWSILTGQGTPRITARAGNGVGNVSVTASNGACTTPSSNLMPNEKLAQNELHFPNVFSPNGDGDNDKWLIRNIENYPENELTILNRWGSEVYRSKSYKQNWTGDKLSEGTYYYVMRVKVCGGEEKVFKGFVMIVR